MGPLYQFHGLSVDCIDKHQPNSDARRRAYMADITFGTNNEFGFDYLRDNMAVSPKDLVQRKHNYAIVDEVDSVLIDDARTPLIISGPVPKGEDQLFEQLRPLVERLFEAQKKLATQYLADAKRLIASDDKKDQEEGFLALFRSHKALPKNKPLIKFLSEQGIKAGMLKTATQTFATITLQNYFRMYHKLSGMTGTAETEAGELWDIYKLDVVVIPTNRPIARKDMNDRVYKTKREKYKAVIEEIEEMVKEGRPVLVGTTSVEISEMLSKMLAMRKIEHNVLNAKLHQREADIVAQAGQKSIVTIATNMAGRGTDIKLSPEVKAAGGLAIIGTERHESRRVDRQLRGRAGRQGETNSVWLFIPNVVMP